MQRAKRIPPQLRWSFPSSRAEPPTVGVVEGLGSGRDDGSLIAHATRWGRKLEQLVQRDRQVAHALADGVISVRAVAPASSAPTSSVQGLYRYGRSPSAGRNRRRPCP